MSGDFSVSCSTVIATLGTEPQVVTTALDLLLSRSEIVNHVDVVHTSGVSGAVAVLQEVSKEYASFCSWNFYPVQLEGKDLPDVDTPLAGEITFRLLYQLILKAKKEENKVHLLIAGGRKTASIYGMVAAQLLFDDRDHLWHLFSSGDFLTSKRLHPQPGDDVHLAPIPVLLWSHISPIFSRLGQVEDPFMAVKMVEELQLEQKMETCRSFVLGSLTSAEERVVRLLVLQGSSDQEIGEQLHLSPRTVEQHLRSAYAKASDHWEIESVTRTQLISLLNLYYSTEIRGKPA